MLTHWSWPPRTTSSPTPRNPTASPTSVARTGRSPATVRMSSNQSGTEATTSAARPAGTWRSARLTKPFPPVSNNTPDERDRGELAGPQARCPPVTQREEGVHRREEGVHRGSRCDVPDPGAYQRRNRPAMIRIPT